jgi:CBS domain-containing protein
MPIRLTARISLYGLRVRHGTVARQRGDDTRSNRVGESAEFVWAQREAARHRFKERLASRPSNIPSIIVLASDDTGSVSTTARRRRRMMKVSSVMSRDVQLIHPDATLRDAAQLMQKIDTGALPVGESDTLVGMITDRDIAIRGVAQGKGPDARVRETMTPDVKYCFETEDVAHVAKNMAELQIRRLPVMNREKRLIGIVSLGDLATDASLSKSAEALRGVSREGGGRNQSRAAS